MYRYFMSVLVLVCVEIGGHDVKGFVHVICTNI